MEVAWIEQFVSPVCSIDGRGAKLYLIMFYTPMTTAQIRVSKEKKIENLIGLTWANDGQDLSEHHIQK